MCIIVISSQQTKVDAKEEKQEEVTEEKQEDEEPLDSTVLDDFTRNIFPGRVKICNRNAVYKYPISKPQVLCVVILKQSINLSINYSE